MGINGPLPPPVPESRPRLDGVSELEAGVTLSLCARAVGARLVALPALPSYIGAHNCERFSWHVSDEPGAGATARYDEPYLHRGRELPRPPASLQRLSVRELASVLQFGLCGHMKRACTAA